MDYASKSSPRLGEGEQGEGMNCPLCGKKMVPESGNTTYTTNPPQWDERWRCMGDGYTTVWTSVNGKSREQLLQDKWDELNK